MTSGKTPTRSHKQRTDALRTANKIRQHRAQLKKDLKSGKSGVVDLLKSPHKEIETMYLVHLLMAIPKIGRTKVNRILVHCRISPSKTIGGLSLRQRKEIVDHLGLLSKERANRRR